MPMIFRIPSHCRIIRTFYSTVRPVFELVIVTVHRTVTFSHSSPLSHNARKSNTERCWTFLAGALGLEPRAYGFGDRRSTN